MQHPAKQPVINPLTLDIQIEDYLAQRFLRKPKSKVSWKTVNLLGHCAKDTKLVHIDGNK